ncbi:MAG: hypothetical protein JRE45_08370 [Deltaproteobacteria bacterium]|nr:hypothetical protein [Deltaproteobacteria bacterium]MBW2627619.1 hypothetical protein [Deltaproteobacteria bacterium]
MAQIERNQAQNRHSRVQARPRKATVVHDGSAFQLAADLRAYGFEVAEGPLLSSWTTHDDPGSLAILATRPGATRSERLREWTHHLCWKGATLLAVGAAVGPVAEFFGAPRTTPSQQRVSGRLANIGSVGQGLVTGLPAQFRLALPAGDRFPTSELSSEFGATAWSQDGELIAASHVFRPVHLLHAGALESEELRPVVLKNLLRLLREKGGRAF